LRHGVVASGHVTQVHVTPLASDAPDVEAFLQPFDVLTEPRASSVRAVSRDWLRRWIADWPSMALPSIEVTAGALGALVPFAHQLSPAAAIVSGDATRLVLADDVGAGKTVEAGLIVAELASRGVADRVVVLTPSAIRDQWADEIGRLCGLSLDVLDRTAFRLRCRDAPHGFGPFEAPCRVVLSMDLAKRADVLTQLLATIWDVLVVDEAHLTSGDSARMAAVQALGRRARVVLLLTATPHGGDPAAYARLCRIGELGDGPPLRFTRPAPRSHGRRPPRMRRVVPSRSVAERAMTESLTCYVRRLDRSGSPAARLIAVVLRKRALSSPHALVSSLRHRARWLSGQPRNGAQACLPFDDDEQDDGDIEQPAALNETTLLDVESELAMVQQTLAAATEAARSWSKGQPLVRLMRRTEERALVFTEYRDTLDAVLQLMPAGLPVAVLHGGLTRRERAEAVARFVAGDARVLIATDVAAEGLNLQRLCRLVIHVELPWSPTRLTQRNGRVDRIGQLRCVHIWQLLGDRRHEARVVASLSARLDRMREAGLDVGGLASRRDQPPSMSVAAGGSARTSVAPSDFALVQDRQLIARLVHACRRGGSVGVTRRGNGLAWLTLRRPVAQLAPGVVVLCLAPATMRGTRPSLVALHVALHRWPAGPPRDWVGSLAALAAATVRPDSALSHSLGRREARLLRDAIEEREQTSRRWQASLFERRTARLVAAARDRASERIAAHELRLRELGAESAAAIPLVALLAR
jgi:superfamily II DNA or RNA helicase